MTLAKQYRRPLAKIRKEAQAFRDNLARKIERLKGMTVKEAVNFLDGMDFIESAHIVKQAYGFSDQQNYEFFEKHFKR